MAWVATDISIPRIGLDRLRTPVRLLADASVANSDRGPFGILMAMAQESQAVAEEPRLPAALPLDAEPAQCPGEPLPVIGAELPVADAEPRERADAARNRRRIL